MNALSTPLVPEPEDSVSLLFPLFNILVSSPKAGILYPPKPNRLFGNMKLKGLGIIGIENMLVFIEKGIGEKALEKMLLQDGKIVLKLLNGTIE